MGGGVAADIMTDSATSPSGDGVHFLVYKQNQELHTLRWLNPQVFGPFDHKWEVSGGAKGADILCTNEDGDLVEDCYDGAPDVLGITHYRVTAIDDNGNTAYVAKVRVVNSDPVYAATFPLNDGTYTFAVDAGYVEDNNFYPLSDKAQFEFEIPDDYTKWNQETNEIVNLLDDILGDVRLEEDGFDAFSDSVWDYTGYTADGKDPKLPAIIPVRDLAPEDAENPVTQADVDADLAANELSRQHALTIYLNNLYN